MPEEIRMKMPVLGVVENGRMEACQFLISLKELEPDRVRYQEWLVSLTEEEQIRRGMVPKIVPIIWKRKI